MIRSENLADQHVGHNAADVWRRILLGSIMFGRMTVREPLSGRVEFANDDLVRNIYRWVCEQRLALAVKHPSAILSITMLPVS